MRFNTLASLLTLFPLAALPAFCQMQTTTVPHPQGGQTPGGSVSSKLPTGAQPVEDHIRYRIFFQHLENLDKAAAQLDTQGKDGSGFRNYEQNKAKLTDAEGQAMKQVAFDCNRAVADVLAKRKVIIDGLRAQYPHTPLYKLPSLYNVPLPAELDQFNLQEKQIVLDHLAQLKSALGDASFQKLDAWVRQRVHPRVIGIQAPGEKIGNPPPPINALTPVPAQKVAP
jgi:hypothetical protein